MKSLLSLILLFTTSLLAKTYNVSNIDEFRVVLDKVLDSNSSDEIVLQKGYYKTTKDNNGSFGGKVEYSKNITIRAKDGLSYKDVVLNGGGESSVLFFEAPKKSSLKIKNISIINGNSAESYGGGIYFNRELIIDSCKISNNISENSGAGIYGRIVNITNSLIYNNISVNNGGGVYAREIYVKDSMIRDNISNNNGAGIYSKVVKVENSTIKDNISDSSGGGIYGKNIEVINSKILDNANDSFGGGIYGPRSAFIKVVNSTIEGNANDNNGGGVYGSRYSDIVIFNSKIIDNSVNGRGAGVFGDWYSDILIANSIIANNKSGENATAICGEKVSHISLINSTIFNNQNPKNLASIEGSGLFLNSIIDSKINFKDNSKVYNSYILNDFNLSFKITQKDNINSDKLKLKDDFKLTINSILIDKGLNPKDKIFIGLIDDEVLNDDIKVDLRETLKFDIDKNKRVIGKSIDIGASEYEK